MNFLRSLLHALWMLVTVVPWGLLMLLVSTRVRGVRLYWMAVRWLRWRPFLYNPRGSSRPPHARLLRRKPKRRFHRSSRPSSRTGSTRPLNALKR